MPPIPRLQPPPYNVTEDAVAREVVIEVFRAGGPGGQHRNVTESAVRIRHLPSGVQVTAADSRSQHRNRALAFERLVRRLEQLNRVRTRRIPTRVSKRAVEHRLADKRRRQAVKRHRALPHHDD